MIRVPHIHKWLNHLHHHVCPHTVHSREDMTKSKTHKAQTHQWLSICVYPCMYMQYSLMRSLPACLADRREDRTRQGKVKNWFSVLCLSLGTPALTAHRPFASPSHRVTVPGQQRRPPCWGVFPVPRRAGMAVRSQPFPRSKQASDSGAWAGESSESATSRLAGGCFIVGGLYQLSVQTRGEPARKNYGFI